MNLLISHLLAIGVISLRFVASIRFEDNQSTTCDAPDQICIIITSCPSASSASGNPKTCGWESDVPMVCCSQEPSKNEPLSTDEPLSRSEPLSTDDPLSANEPSSTDGPLSANEPSSTEHPWMANACGKRPEPPIVLSRVEGGTAATAKWPWMVAIFYTDKRKPGCGGSLIDAWHIVTAAHCFNQSHDPAAYTVEIGEMFLDPSNYQYEIQDLRIAPAYTPGYFYHDIAILTLAHPAPHELTPVCFAEIVDAFEGHDVSLLGWGHLYDGGESPDVLQELHGLKVVDTEKCHKIYKTFVYDSESQFDAHFPTGIHDTNFICAGVEEGFKDSCRGDSGGPLLRQDKRGFWHLVGAVSFGYKCGMPGVPGVYTRITSYYDWISDVLGMPWTDISEKIWAEDT